MIYFNYNVITGLVSWSFKRPKIFDCKTEERKVEPPPRDKRSTRERQGFKRRY